MFSVRGGLTNSEALTLLEQTTAELTEMHRGKHYSLWRDERRRSPDDVLELLAMHFMHFDRSIAQLREFAPAPIGQ